MKWDKHGFLTFITYDDNDIGENKILLAVYEELQNGTELVCSRMRCGEYGIVRTNKD